MTAAYLAVAALALVAVGQVTYRRTHATFTANTSCFPKAFRTRAGRVWVEGPDSLYDLDGSPDPNFQGWPLDSVRRAHGRLTRIPHPKDTP